MRTSDYDFRIGDLVKTINGQIGLVVEELAPGGPHDFLVSLFKNVHGRSMWGFKSADIEVIKDAKEAK